MVIQGLSASRLLVIVFVALAACSSTTSAAKCYQKTQSPVSTPATEATQIPTQTSEMLEDAAPTQASQASERSSSVGQEGSSQSIPMSTGSLSITESPTESTSGVASTTSTSGAATFGDITSASGECVVGNPNTYVTTEDMDWVWKNTLSEATMPYTNWIFDQVVGNNGSLNYCIRWDSKLKLEKTVASKFESMLKRQINLWNHWLVGYDCWPFETIDITVVGFAVLDKSILDWSDDSLGPIYEGLKDDEGSPKCPDECYRRQDGDTENKDCKGTPFDMSLWPSDYVGEGISGLASDWGQRVEVTNMLNDMDKEQMQILAHEMGHGYGLDDMYVDANKPVGFPACIMDASPTLTDADGWMLRRILEHVKSRLKF